MNVTKIMTRPLKSSFFSCEKDAEEIIKRLFVSSQPYSDQLKRLLMPDLRPPMRIVNEYSRSVLPCITSENEYFKGFFGGRRPVSDWPDLHWKNQTDSGPDPCGLCGFAAGFPARPGSPG